MPRECCSVDECYLPIFRGEYCGAHHKRAQRNQPVAGLILEKLSPEGRTIKAGSEWIEASSEADNIYEHKRAAFLRAAAAWMKSLGWRPPLSKQSRAR